MNGLIENCFMGELRRLVDEVEDGVPEVSIRFSFDESGFQYRIYIGTNTFYKEVFSDTLDVDVVKGMVDELIKSYKNASLQRPYNCNYSRMGEPVFVQWDGEIRNTGETLQEVIERG